MCARVCVCVKSVPASSSLNAFLVQRWVNTITRMGTGDMVND